MDVLEFIEELDSDDDREIINFIDYERRPYILKERIDLFMTLDDKDFIMRFRLKKETVLNLLEKIEGQLESVTDR